MRGLWKYGQSVVLLATVVMAIGYVGIIVVSDFNARRDGVQTEVRGGLEDFVAATEAYFASYEAVVAAVAETACVRGRGQVECGDLFSRLNRRFPNAVNFAAIGRDGRFFASGQPFPPSGPPDASNYPFFATLAKEDRRFYVMDPHTGPVSGEPVTGLVLPLKDADSRFDGVAGVSLRFAELQAIWARVKPPSDVGIVIFDRRRALIFASPEAEAVAEAGEEAHARLYDSLAAPEGAVRLAGKSWVFHRAQVAGNDWMIAAIHPGPYDIANYLRDTSVLPKLLVPVVLLGVLGLVLSLRDWRQMFALERQVMERTAELTQANADLKRSNRDMAATVAELETFAWVASHDLREPLRTISSYVTMLERRYGERLDEDGRQFVAYARDGAQRMNDLVLDLLEYVDAGGPGGQVRLVEVEAVARRALRDLDGLTASSGGVATVRPPMPSLLLCESDLARLFTNLVANAIKYRHPERPPEVTLAAEWGEAGWVFSVTDNGIGVEPQYFEKIFQLFQRLDPKADTEGTGIGLAICRKVVGRYGGRIWVESEPGKGSRFLFTLPDAVPADALPVA
jgi:signal transduction histidine kinase